MTLRIVKNFAKSLKVVQGCSRSFEITHDEYGVRKVLVSYSEPKYESILYQTYSASNIVVTLKSWLGTSFKVIKNGTIRQLGLGFLFEIHSNCGHSFSRYNTGT